MRTVMLILVLCLVLPGAVQAQNVTELREEYKAAQTLAAKYHEYLQQLQTSQEQLELEIAAAKQSVAKITAQQSHLEAEMQMHQQVVEKSRDSLSVVADQLDQHAPLYKEQQEAVLAAITQANKVKTQAQLPAHGLDNHQQSFRMNAFMDYLVYSNGAAYMRVADEYQHLKEKYLQLQAQLGELNKKTDQLETDLTMLANDHTASQSEQVRIAQELELTQVEVTSHKHLLYEQTAITQLAKTKLVEQLGFVDFSWPLAEKGTLTSDYGYRMHPIFNERRFHTGVDLALSAGEPVKAVADGVVIVAGDVAGYGNTVIIDHGLNLTTFYGHNSRLLVSVGDKINRGDLIALIGSTGISTGPHLHFEVRDNNIHVDPWIWLDS